jgi:hypothetical protein
VIVNTFSEKYLGEIWVYHYVEVNNMVLEIICTGVGKVVWKIIVQEFLEVVYNLEE